MSNRAETNLDEPTRRRLAALAGKPPVAWRRIERGASPAERWQLTFDDGATAFAKVSTTAATAQGLRAERAVLTAVSGSFMPKLLGFDDHPERALLLLEDLSGAVWPPPWRPADVQRLLSGLGEMAGTVLPPGAVPELERERARFAGWLTVERDPAPFLSLGLCSADWLELALPSLLLAQDLAWLGGTELVHGDLRSDNLCFVGDRVVFVGWGAARRGSAHFDLGGLAPSLRLEGGPLPDELLPGEGPLAALQSGYFAANAGLAARAHEPRARHRQLRQLRVALPWATRVLGLPPPDLDWLERARARRDAALAAGELDERGWLQAAEEELGDAHLASAEPRVPVCAGLDAGELRLGDELVLDALDGGPASLCVVGAASGFALDGLTRVAAERGQELDGDALDGSPRLAELARARWPERATRFASGSVLEHTPGRRYDLVVTTLEQVPAPRRRDWVEQLRAGWLSPGGRVVLAPERAGDGPDPAQRAAALGLAPSGVLERALPATGGSLRGAWLER